MKTVGIATGRPSAPKSSAQQSNRCQSGPSASASSCRTVCSSRGGRRHVVAAAFPGEAGSWGEQFRPDTCNMDDQDRPGPLCDLDEEWQEFISGRGRYTQPQPLLWDSDTRTSSQWPPSSSSNSNSSNSSNSNSSPSTGNRGPEASCSNRYSSSIQSFDDWDAMEGDYALPVPCNVPVNEVNALPMATTSNNTINPAGAAAAAAAAAQAASIHSPSGATGADALWAAALQRSRDLVTPADVLGSRGLWQDMREVYVLLFGVGQKDTEGIYSLRAVSEDGLPTETIIAFENIDDAVRYAALLEATMEHCPHVCSIPPAELMAFCSDSGYRCRLELEGSLLMPPEYNVHVTDWERSLRLREGKFHVLQEEPDMAGADPLELGFPMPSSMGSMGGYSLSRDSPFNEPAGEFSASKLDALRAQLEALLPATPSVDDERMPDS